MPNDMTSREWRPILLCSKQSRQHHTVYLLTHFQDSPTSVWPDPGEVCWRLSVRDEAIPESTPHLPLFRCRAGHMISISGERSPAWHWEDGQSVFIHMFVHSKLPETRIGEQTGSHFWSKLFVPYCTCSFQCQAFQGGCSCSLPADRLHCRVFHLPPLEGRRLPAPTDESCCHPAGTTSGPFPTSHRWAHQFGVPPFLNHRGDMELTCPGRKWICVTAVVSLWSPVNSTPGTP